MKDAGTLDTTIDEWRAEMEKYDLGDVPGKTIPELSQELGISESTMRNRIQHLTDNGRCIDKKGMRIDQLGRRFEVTVYQLPKEKKE